MQMGDERGGWLFWVLYVLVLGIVLGLFVDTASAQGTSFIGSADSYSTSGTPNCHSVIRHYGTAHIEGVVVEASTGGDLADAVNSGSTVSGAIGVFCSLGTSSGNLVDATFSVSSCSISGQCTADTYADLGSKDGNNSASNRGYWSEYTPVACGTATQGTFFSCSTLPQTACFSGCEGSIVESGSYGGGTESPCGVGAAEYWATYVLDDGNEGACTGDITDDPTIAEDSPPGDPGDPEPDPEPEPEDPTTPYEPSPPPSEPSFPGGTDPDGIQDSVYGSAEEIIKHIRWSGEGTHDGLAAINDNLSGPVLDALSGLPGGGGSGEGEGGNGCESPPVCDIPGSDACLILLQDWEQWCDGSGDGLGDGLGDGAGDSDDPGELWTDFDELPQSLDQSSWLGAAECPADVSVPVGGSSFVISLYPLCQVLSMMGALVMAAGAYVSARIVLGAI